MTTWAVSAVIATDCDPGAAIAPDALTDAALPPLAQARVAAAHALNIVAAARDLGVEIDRIARDSGLDHRTLLAGSEEPIEARACLAFMDAAAHALGNPLFGLEAGLRSRVTDNRGYGLLLLACKDIRSVIEQVCRFEALSHDLFRTTLVEADGAASLRIHSPWLDRPGGRQVLYWSAAAIRAHARWLIGSDLPVFEFSSTLARPDGLAGEYERILGAPTRWGARYNEVAFPAAVLDIPIPSADPGLLPALQRTAEARLEAMRRAGEPSTVGAARAQIVALLPRGPSLARVAAGLAMTPRSLQRRLSECGVTFSRLLDDVRRTQAQIYLGQRDLSLTEIAFLLGFSDQTAFNHAFRNWFMMSPGAWRARNIKR